MTRYGQKGLAYFHQRGINEETIKEFQLGFAPDAWDKLSTAFEPNLAMTQMNLANLYRTTQRYVESEAFINCKC